MSATLPDTRRPADAATGLVGIGILVRFLLRRDRVKLPAWTGGMGLFVIYVASAIPQIAETEEELRGATQLFADPVGRLLIGPGYGFDEPTFASFVANGYGLYFLLIAALMSILLVVRHTRVEEQTGRAELVRANVVGRSALLTAAIIVAVITNLVGGIVVTIAMVGVGGFGIGGSLVFGASIAATGMVFAGVATITVQLSQYSRAAAGSAGAVLGVAFLLRAGGDMAQLGGNALSWMSPLGWGQQTGPFALDRWWPLSLSLALTGATVALGYTLSGRRDFGAGLLATRPGPATASPSMGTPLGLAWRLQRASIVGWGVALVISGLAFGAYAQAMLDAIDDLPDIFLDLFGSDDMLAGYLAYMAVYMAFLAASYAIVAVQGLRGEETRGRLEPVLATAVSRHQWLGSHLLVIAGGVTLIMALTGAATGLGAALVTGDASHITDLTAAHLNQVPGVWVVMGVAALLFGVLPRAIPAAWTLVGYGLVMGTFGPMLNLPEAAANLSPFSHAAELPLADFDPVPVLVLTVVAVGLAGIGLAGFRRRNVTAA